MRALRGDSSMNHIAAVVATALFVGAGTGALSGPSDTVLNDVANPMISGQAMLVNQTIADNLAKSPDHTLFYAAIQQTGLTDVLKGKGPFTVFAPNDQAFATMPASKSGALFAKDKAMLAKTVRYLVVRGRYDSPELLKKISDDGGITRLKTLSGGVITAAMNGPTNIVLTDETGVQADITIYDIYQSNGVMMVVDEVMTPDLGEHRLAGLGSF